MGARLGPIARSRCQRIFRRWPSFAVLGCPMPVFQIGSVCRFVWLEIAVRVQVFLGLSAGPLGGALNRSFVSGARGQNARDAIHARPTLAGRDPRVVASLEALRARAPPFGTRGEKYAETGRPPGPAYVESLSFEVLEGSHRLAGCSKHALPVHCSDRRIYKYSSGYK